MAQKFTFDTTAASAIAEEQIAINADMARKKEVSAETKEAIDGAKVRQYANMMAALKDAPRSKGQLTRPARSAVEDGMTAVDIDISKGQGKRLYDGSVALTNKAVYKRIFGDEMPTQGTASFFEARLIEQGLDNERKITAAAFPAQSGDDIDAIVRKVVGGYTYAKDENGERKINNWRAGKLVDQFDEVIEALHNAKRISDAVKATAEEVGKENIDISRILTDLGIE